MVLIASEANAPWGARWARWARSELVRGSFGARSGSLELIGPRRSQCGQLVTCSSVTSFRSRSVSENIESAYPRAEAKP